MVIERAKAPAMMDLAAGKMADEIAAHTRRLDASTSWSRGTSRCIARLYPFKAGAQ